MFFILLRLQSTTKPPSNQHIYRIPVTQTTRQILDSHSDADEQVQSFGILCIAIC